MAAAAVTTAAALHWMIYTSFFFRASSFFLEPRPALLFLSVSKVLYLVDLYNTCLVFYRTQSTRFGLISVCVFVSFLQGRVSRVLLNLKLDRVCLNMRWISAYIFQGMYERAYTRQNVFYVFHFLEFQEGLLAIQLDTKFADRTPALWDVPSDNLLVLIFLLFTCENKSEN